MVNPDVGTGDDGPPVPSSEEEAMFLAEQRELGGGEVPVSSTKLKEIEVEEEKGELPPMEDLVKRIPSAARDTLEELFRARFITVKRIPKSALKK